MEACALHCAAALDLVRIALLGFQVAHGLWFEIELLAIFLMLLGIRHLDASVWLAANDTSLPQRLGPAKDPLAALTAEPPQPTIWRTPVRGDPATAAPLVPSGFFVMRTPLLPFQELHDWSADVEAPEAPDDPGALERDRELL